MIFSLSKIIVSERLHENARISCDIIDTATHGVVSHAGAGLVHAGCRTDLRLEGSGRLPQKNCVSPCAIYGKGEHNRQCLLGMTTFAEVMHILTTDIYNSDGSRG
jgi:hypothetical protein